jgi:hypothetical protein
MTNKAKLKFKMTVNFYYFFLKHSINTDIYTHINTYPYGHTYAHHIFMTTF